MATSTWADEILNGVKEVKYRGRAGFFVVYGKESDAILTSKLGEVLIAAGELGKGRVIAVAHGGFVKHFSQSVFPDANATLLKNMKNWVSRGTGESENVQDINSLNDWSEVKPCKLIAWNGGPSQKNEAFLQGLTTWVENGGGLVCGMVPWNLGVGVRNASLSKFLREIGIAYAGKKWFSVKNRLSVDTNCAQFARIDNAAEVLLQEGYPTKVSRVLAHIAFVQPDALGPVRAAVEKLKRKYQCVPSKANPVKRDYEKLLTNIACQLYEIDGKLGNPVRAEGVEHFPGDFETPPKLETMKCTINSSGYRMHPTGCYLPPGTCMTVEWSGPLQWEWTIVVGPQKDTLHKVTGGWRRWPKVTVKNTMQTSPMKMSNPFGGLIYVQSPKGSSTEATLDIEFQNVVPAPRFTFDLASQWETVEVKKPGLWCDVSSELLTFTLPSESVRHLPDLSETMKLWDKVVRAHVDLRGCDASNGRGQWVVSDEQLAAGSMHAGYPICTHLGPTHPFKNGGKDFLLNGERLEKIQGKGFWGLFHELGHNYQHGAWTWEGTIEVTVNIFSLHASEIMYGVTPWEHPWLNGQMRRIRKYLENGADYSVWKKNPGVALAIYAQQARDLGWGVFKAVFREYEDLPKQEKPKGDDEEVSQWITRLSRTSQRNLCPVFEFWAIPVDDQARAKTAGLPPYLPVDETTKEMAPERARSIANKYGIPWN